MCRAGRRSPGRGDRWCSCSTAARAPGAVPGSSGWREQADATGFVAVFPTGLRYRVLDSGRLSTKWNGFDLADEVDLDERPDGYPDDAPWPANDVGFVDSIMGDLGARLPIDRQRVYASGFSNGAGFAARLAVERSQVLAAAAFSASALPAAQVALRPTPMWLVAGCSTTGPGADRPSAADRAAARPGCAAGRAGGRLVGRCPPRHGRARRAASGTLALRDSTAFRWPAVGQGPGGGVFRFTLLAGLGHHFPHARNNDAGFEAAPEFWEFFKTHRLP